MQIIGNTLTPLFDYLEQEVIHDVARRVQNTLTYTRTAELQALSLRKLGYSPAQIRKEAMKLLNADKDYRKAVAKNTAEYKKEVSKLIQDIENKAYIAGNKIIAGAGDMSWYSDLSVWRDNGKKLTTSLEDQGLAQLVRGIQRQTKGQLKNLTQSTGFDGMNGFESIRNAYRAELDKAQIKLLSGAFSQDQVVKECVKGLAMSGLRTINFASGHADHLDVAVKRAIRTGAHQLSLEVQRYNISEMGENLVYVQPHAGARNKGSGVANHAEWQGKVYYIRPGVNYTAEETRLGYKIYDLWDKTGYSVDGAHDNNPLGLCGYNCRHLYFPWFEGVSETSYKEAEHKNVEYNGKTLDYYAQTQEARRQERHIRQLKREKEAYTNLGLDTKEINDKIKIADMKYKGFCQKCGMPINTTNTRYESGSADWTKTKAYAEYKKAQALAKQKASTVTATTEKSAPGSIKDQLAELEKKVKELESEKNALGLKLFDDDFTDGAKYSEAFSKWQEAQKELADFMSKNAEEVNKITKFRHIDNVKDAESKLKQIGFKNVSSTALQINSEMLVNSVNRLVDLEKQYGAIEKSTMNVCYKRSRTAKSSVSYTYANPSDQDLNLTPYFKNTQAKIESDLKHEIETMYKMPASEEMYKYYTMTHEYGHIVEHNIVANTMWDGMSNDEIINTLRSKNRLDRLITSKEKAIQKEIMDIAKNNNPNIIITESISGYGKSDTAEFFAEAFANAHCGKPNAIGVAMLEWLKKKGWG